MVTIHQNNCIKAMQKQLSSTLGVAKSSLQSFEKNPTDN
jgi:DNA-binding XRE family transcriptional regulator